MSSKDRFKIVHNNIVANIFRRISAKMAVIPPTSASVFLLLALLSVPLCRSAEPQEAAEAEEPEYKRYVKEEHQYYHLHLYQDNYDGAYDRHLVDLKADPEARTHEFLSGHSQAAEAVEPGFQFPFYGHMVDRFYVTTHGFLSFAPRLHNLMYKTQYIAPLRVKLDPGASTYATVDYVAKEDRLTVQWTNVSVAEPYQHPMGGQFTFQVCDDSVGAIPEKAKKNSSFPILPIVIFPLIEF